MPQLIGIVDAVGVCGTDTRIGLDNDGIADLRKEFLASFERRDLREARSGDARLFVEGFHGGFVLDVIHVAA